MPPDQLRDDAGDCWSDLRARLLRCRELLADQDIAGYSEAELHGMLHQVYRLLGPLANDLSRSQSRLIAAWLATRFPGLEWDWQNHHPNRNGFDVDLVHGGKRIVGEAKSTFPAGTNGRLGGNQRTQCERDLAKLVAEKADHKFFFVLYPETVKALKAGFDSQFDVIELVQLTADAEK